MWWDAKLLGQSWDEAWAVHADTKEGAAKSLVESQYPISKPAEVVVRRRLDGQAVLVKLT